VNAPIDTRLTSDPWWKASVVYQIYPRSFADSDGDGVGDLRGILDHLDHVADLGADVVWLSPVYPSPQDDNGYDISDYQDIDPTFGSLADLDDLIAALHARGMRLLMDLVVNHTSDEHPWFAASRSSRDGDKADWYIWRDPRPGFTPGTPEAAPSNWGSVFSGSAWEWAPEREQYYLHLFSRKQPDLNWDNPEVRSAVFAMMRWWLDRGVDGFRMDVVNLLSKDPEFPDLPVTGTGLGDGLRHTASGPRIHEHLAEMRREVFDSRPEVLLTVGEMPASTPEQALRFTRRDTGPLDMVFQFEHVDLDHEETSKWVRRPMTLVDLKQSFGRWQEAMGDLGWNSLYWSNHDQPRAVSRFGSDTAYWRESATALATVLHLHRGTPYVYQGEELGMTNAQFDDLTAFRDIESSNHYRHAVDVLGHDPDEVLVDLRRASRDNARTPMQWTAGPQAGFSAGEPWLPANPNHTWLNADSQRGDPGSVLAHYRALIGLRHHEPTVVDGDFTLLEPNHPRLYAFERRLGDDCLAVYANLSDDPIAVDLPQGWEQWELLLGNLPPGQSSGGPRFAPWEARVLRHG
jgi:oligo-1,6-glucosidase